MNSIVKFFHTFMNPHCPQCEMDRQVSNINPLAETLKNELERSYRNNDRLLEMLFDKYEHNKEKENSIGQADNRTMMPLPIIGKGNWANRRRELEQAKRDEARAAAKIAHDSGLPQITVDDLDSELASVREN